MDVIALVTIGGYLVIATLIGSTMARRSQSAAGWAVAGGGMSAAMIAVGVAGTRIGAGGTYGVAGDVITGGVWNLWWYGINTFLALTLVGVLFAVYYRRFRLHTVGELFTIRWGRRRCQWLTSLCVQTEYAIVNVIEAYVIGVILSTLTPLPMFAGVMIAAVIFSTYVSLGGLWGTAVTNLIHCTMVIVGLGAVGIMGIEQLGGWDQVTASVNEQLRVASQSETAWWGLVGAGWLPVFAMFFAAAVHTPAASVYTNYATAAKRETLIAPAFGWCHRWAHVRPRWPDWYFDHRPIRRGCGAERIPKPDDARLRAGISDLPAPDGPFIHLKAAQRTKRLFVTASSRFRGRQLSAGGRASH